MLETDDHAWEVHDGHSDSRLVGGSSKRGLLALERLLDGRRCPTSSRSHLRIMPWQCSMNRRASGCRFSIEVRIAR